MKMFLTRLGFGSKIVVTGDITQVDLPGGRRSGLRDGPGDPRRHRGHPLRRLTSADVVRHRLVGDIVDAYERWDADQAARARPTGAPAHARPGGPTAPTGERTPMSIEVANESGIDVDEVELVARRPVRRSTQMRINPLAELSMLLVDVDAMTELHERWMDEPGPDRRAEPSRWTSCDTGRPAGRPRTRAGAAR